MPLLISLPTFFALFTLTSIVLLVTAMGDVSAQVPSVQQQSKTHEYTLVTEETTLEIAPGVRVDAWTYNGTIPDPTRILIMGNVHSL